MHKLLERQIAKYFKGNLPEDMRAFLTDVDTAYVEADKDRAMLERALDITSAEMMELYVNLKLDMEKRVAAERELGIAKEKFLGGQKHEALGQLAGNIAHDFNNILAIVKGYAEVLGEDLKEIPKYKADLQEILLAADRGRDLTGQILAYAKHQQLNLRAMNLNQLIGKYKAMLGAALGPGIKLQLQLNAADYCVLLDETYFSQILLNFTVNARDAMNGKGEFTIKSGYLARGDVALEDKSANDLLKNHKFGEDGEKDSSGGFISVEFSDTGTGIPADAIPRIFEPYYTTKEMGKGTGLGLAVVYGIVKQLNGYIFCSSQENVGTTFRIFLPTVSDQAERDPIPLIRAADKGLIDPSCIRVLVVDDERSLREWVVHNLRQDKFVVQQAENGDAAVAYIGEHPGEIDLIVSDVMMPGMTGLEMAAEIRQMQPKISILFMSGYSEVALNHNWSGEKMRLLEKPFSRTELMAGVYKLIKSA